MISNGFRMATANPRDMERNMDCPLRNLAPAFNQDVEVELRPVFEPEAKQGLDAGDLIRPDDQRSGVNALLRDADPGEYDPQTLLVTAGEVPYME